LKSSADVQKEGGLFGGTPPLSARRDGTNTPRESKPAEAGEPSELKPEEPKEAVVTGPSCSTCQQALVTDFRTHCKTELHNFNVKRKVKGLPPLNQDQLEEARFDEYYVENFRGVD